ncbi:BatA domain-containing protein [bacterium]|nr:BatA domain-containing protein [bacterium]
MSFLQVWLLWGLPLVAIPIIIHLLNQWRYQTVPWGAMMFLLAAQRMSRGYSRLRQWLILALRMLAIAALVIVVSRPLLGGWMGNLLGEKPDWTIVLLDRSPSMQQSVVAGGADEAGVG